MKRDKKKTITYNLSGKEEELEKFIVLRDALNRALKHFSEDHIAVIQLREEIDKLKLTK